MNNAYEVKVAAPLLRPGLTITTVVSRGYLEDAVTVLMDAVRAVNHPTPPPMGHGMGTATIERVDTQGPFAPSVSQVAKAEAAAQANADMVKDALAARVEQLEQ